MSLYSDVIVDLYQHPLHRGVLEDATHSAAGVNTTCGDHVRIQLRIRNGVIENVMWEGDGCAISVSSASLLADEWIGKSVDSIASLDSHSLLELLGVPDLGPARVKCATLALETAQKALNNASL